MTTVARLLQTPVKSLRLAERDEITIGPEGVEDDRVFFLLDAQGSVVRGPRRLPLCMGTAALADDVLAIDLPDGSRVEGPVIAEGDPITVRWDMGLEIEARLVGGDWAEALSDFAGEPIRLARVAGERGGWSGFPVSIIGGPSIDALGLGPLDPRRFRMLVETTGGAPFEEDAWVGRDVRIGEAVVHVDEVCPRCVVTTVDPDSGRQDLDTLRAMIDAKGAADLGVYGSVVAPGRVRLGDAVAPV